MPPLRCNYTSLVVAYSVDINKIYIRYTLNINIVYLKGNSNCCRLSILESPGIFLLDSSRYFLVQFFKDLTRTTKWKSEKKKGSENKLSHIYGMCSSNSGHRFGA